MTRGRTRSRCTATLGLAAPALLLTAAGCGGIATEAPGSGQDDPLVYGTDDRKEYGQVVNTPSHDWADSTAMLVTSNKVSCSGSTCTLFPQPWTTEQSTGKRLCSNVHYRGQPTLSLGLLGGIGGYCTGFLVAPNVLATAAHCMDNGLTACEGTKLVFGYTANASGGGVPTSVPLDNVYQCVSATTTDNQTTGEDWSLLVLDRPVAGRRIPLNVRYVSSVPTGTALAIIGHPLGIPMKISPTGTLKAKPPTDTTDPAVALYHNVDSFEGNSGSPVFDANTGLVEGVHIHAPTGFAHFFDSSDASGPCLAEQTCPVTGCGPNSTFSYATRVTRFSQLIPLTPALTFTAISING